MRKANANCGTCGASFYARPLTLRQANHFCSKTCYQVARSAMKKNTHCKTCSAPLKPGSSSIAQFCSRSCANKGRTGSKYSHDHLLCNTAVRNRSYRELSSMHGEQCAECGQGIVWNGKSLTLQVDHIDGDRSNNNLNNLRLLCPNCHTQTDTYGGRKNKINGALAEWSKAADC